MVRGADWPVLGAVSAGGVIGALARYALAVAWPSEPGAFPVTTFAVNVSGCLAIGALMAVVERRRTGRLVRPFLGTGVLGGYTTFSAYAVETLQALDAGHVFTAGAYLTGTVLAALFATWAGARLVAVFAGPA